jgi:hypothetical protein
LSRYRMTGAMSLDAAVTVRRQARGEAMGY